MTKPKKFARIINRVQKYLLSVMLIFSSITGFAQEAESTLSVESTLSEENALSTEKSPRGRGLAAPAQRGDFWICPGAETALYSSSGVSVGSSLAVAYGNKVSFGFSAAWFFDMNKVLDALELNFLLRYYFKGRLPKEGGSSSGPYLQLMGGPALFFDKTEKASTPAKWGRVSAGATFGWRFLLGKLFFIEPYIRAGYPYLAGAGVSAGLRF